jgi:DHA3 family multidrug efflux protein-like MFS transporter
MSNRHLFFHILGNATLSSTTTLFVWFALTFWIFLETNSVLIASFVAGMYTVATLVCAPFFGAFVDHHRKKTAMMVSSLLSLGLYIVGVFLLWDIEIATLAWSSPLLWGLITVLVAGSVAGNLRTIALSTTVTLLFSDDRDKMNGLIGTSTGISFALTSVFSGLAIGFLGMTESLLIAIGLIGISIVHLLFIPLIESLPDHGNQRPQFDLRGSLNTIKRTPGLFPLIFFTTFNNFLGGVFMALMDPYGLSLMSVQAWGILLASLSGGFMLGGLYIARFGLSANPVRRMLIINCINWVVCIIFVMQPSILLLGVGLLVWMTLYPFIEATEQTIIQKVVPYEQQGRVFGIAQSIESSASPITAFLVGPLTQFIFIPFMTTGLGVESIGAWFGTGPDRGMALVFILAGIIGLVVTLGAFRSRAYTLLSRHFTHT